MQFRDDDHFHDQHGKLDVSDIRGAQPFRYDQFNIQKGMDYYSDVPGTKPQRLHPVEVHRPQFNMEVKDIEGAQPRGKGFYTDRHINPLEPNYLLPSFKVAPPTPLPPARDNINVSDIDGTAPSHLYQGRTRNLALDTSDIAGTRTKVPLHGPDFDDRSRAKMDVRDITNEGIFKTTRVTDPLSPRYAYGRPDAIPSLNHVGAGGAFDSDLVSREHGAFVVGEISGNKSKSLDYFNNKEKSLSLKTKDILGCQVGWRGREVGRRAHNVNDSNDVCDRRDLHAVPNPTQDVPGAQPKLAAFSNRHTSPLNPQYTMLDHMGPKSMEAEKTRPKCCWWPGANGNVASTWRKEGGSVDAIPKWWPKPSTADETRARDFHSQYVEAFCGRPQPRAYATSVQNASTVRLGTAPPRSGSARPATGASRPATGGDDARPETGASRPGTNASRPGTNASRPATGAELRPATGPGAPGPVRPGTNASRPGTNGQNSVMRDANARPVTSKDLAATAMKPPHSPAVHGDPSAKENIAAGAAPEPTVHALSRSRSGSVGSRVSHKSQVSIKPPTGHNARYSPAYHTNTDAGARPPTGLMLPRLASGGSAGRPVSIQAISNRSRPSTGAGASSRVAREAQRLTAADVSAVKSVPDVLTVS
eukprot:Rmarinus@m.25103